MIIRQDDAGEKINHSSKGSKWHGQPEPSDSATETRNEEHEKWNETPQVLWNGQVSGDVKSAGVLVMSIK